MTCPRCGKTKLVVIKMQVSGKPVALESCSVCELRRWHSEGEQIPLTRVLGLAAARR